MKTVRRVVGTVETGKLSSCGCYQVTHHKVYANHRVAKKAGAWNVTPVVRKRTGSGTFVGWWSQSAGWGNW